MSRKITKYLALILALSLLFSLTPELPVALGATSYQETHRAITWTGTWKDYYNPSSGYSGGGTRYTNQAGATATFTFAGTSVSFITTKHTNRGIAKVYIDGVFQQDVDLYSPITQFQQAVYTKTGLTFGTHNIKIEVSQTRNPSSSNTYVDVDAFETDGSPVPPSPPINVQVKLAGGGALIISWINPSEPNFKHVEIWRDGALIREETGTSWTDGNLASGTAYSYKLRTVDTAGNVSDFTQAVSGTPVAGAPTNVKVENEGSGGKLIISWTNPATGTFDHIRIYRSTIPGVLGVPVTTELITGTVYIDSGLTNDSVYYYTVRAVDFSGSESMNFDQYSGIPTVARIYYEDTEPQIVYTGTWIRHPNSGFSGGSVRYSTTEGDYVTFTFSSSSIAWIAAKANNRGVAKVYIDNVFQAEVDLYSPVIVFQEKVFIKTGMLNTTHTIKIEVLKDKNPASSGTVVDVDAFDLTATASVKGEGEIYGKVVNIHGLAIPGTAVRAGSKVVPAISTGEFRIPGLTPGIYTVYYDAPGYISQTQEVIIVLPGKTTVTPTVIMSPVSPIPVAPTVGGAAFNGEIRGRVLNQAGKVIPGTAVRVNSTVIPTNPGGEFRFTLVGPGIYTVYYDAPGYIGQTQVIEVKLDAVTTCPTAIMTPLGEIRGRVISADRRRAIPGTVVRINNIIMSTDRRGNFKFTLVQPGIYKVYYDAPGYKGQVQENITVPPGVSTICPTVIMSR